MWEKHAFSFTHAASEIPAEYPKRDMRKGGVWHWRPGEARAGSEGLRSRPEGWPLERAGKWNRGGRELVRAAAGQTHPRPVVQRRETGVLRTGWVSLLGLTRRLISPPSEAEVQDRSVGRVGFF